MWRFNYTSELYHYGVKGMKWGVRRTPEQLGHRKLSANKPKNLEIEKKQVTGHSATPKQDTPNSIIDHISNDGKVDVRTFYDSDGMKSKDIHTTDHGHPKHHPNGAHVTEYTWNEDGSLESKKSRELTDKERKENSDIL